MPKSTKIILILAILIVVGGVSFVVFINNDWDNGNNSNGIHNLNILDQIFDTQGSSEPTSDVNIDNWKVYENPVYGFSIKIPPEWTIETGFKPEGGEENEVRIIPNHNSKEVAKPIIAIYPRELKINLDEDQLKKYLDNIVGYYEQNYTDMGQYIFQNKMIRKYFKDTTRIDENGQMTLSQIITNLVAYKTADQKVKLIDFVSFGSYSDLYNEDDYVNSIIMSLYIK